MLSAIRNYVFVPSGETIRAVEVTVGTAVAKVAVTLDWTQFGNWHTYATALGTAGIVSLVAFVKGKLPSES